MTYVIWLVIMVVCFVGLVVPCFVCFLVLVLHLFGVCLCCCVFTCVMWCYTCWLTSWLFWVGCIFVAMRCLFVIIDYGLFVLNLCFGVLLLRLFVGNCYLVVWWLLFTLLLF